MVPDVEFVEPGAVPVVVVFELPLEVLEDDELDAAGVADEVGADAAEDGAVELCPP